MPSPEFRDEWMKTVWPHIRLNAKLHLQLLLEAEEPIDKGTIELSESILVLVQIVDDLWEDLQNARSAAV